MFQQIIDGLYGYELSGGGDIHKPSLSVGFVRTRKKNTVDSWTNAATSQCQVDVHLLAFLNKKVLVIF